MVKISHEVRQEEDYIRQTRRYLHQHPELSLQEFETAKFIRQELDKIGVDYVTVGETGTLGLIEGDHPGKTIFLRADIDALGLDDLSGTAYASVNQGVSHACGHDGHVAALLGAARVLVNNKDKIYGRVKLAFQQAEENGSGARLFVADGHLEDVDFAFGIHAASYFDVGVVSAAPGPSMASVDIFTIKVRGNASHAATPHLGADAALATANILTNLQALAARQRNPLEPIVISVGKIEAGTSYNIVASNGYLHGTLRTLNNKTRARLIQKIEDMAKSVGEIHGCQTSFENFEAANVLNNDEEITRYAHFISQGVIDSDKILKDTPPSLGGEDFADYAAVVPAVFVKVGTRSDEKTGYPHHHEKFDMDEEGLVISAQLHVDTVFRWQEFFKED